MANVQYIIRDGRILRNRQPWFRADIEITGDWITGISPADQLQIEGHGTRRMWLFDRSFLFAKVLR